MFNAVARAARSPAWSSSTSLLRRRSPQAASSQARPTTASAQHALADSTLRRSSPWRPPQSARAAPCRKVRPAPGAPAPPPAPALTLAGYREDPSKGAMLRFEDSLPRLPVPSLQETAQRYLKSVHPLLSAAEFEATTKAVDEFAAPGGAGETLQKRLVARREQPGVRNWIIDWWNEAAYLAVRDPVVPYVSYFYSHRDDRKRRDPAKRAAAMATAVLEFKKQVDGKTLEPEYMKKLPMAMSSYEWMFNACRKPAKPSDYPVKYPFQANEHLVVIRKNQFFKVPHAVNGKQLNTSELEKLFRRVYQMAEKSPPVGVLTTQNRDVWADVHARLLKAHPSNAAALETIESSSFVVCLDDATPVTLDERARQYWHGDGRNRWFDKPLQFIINDNGTSGFMGEHSMMDGTPTHRLNDYANAVIFGNKLDFDDASVRSNLPEPMPLRFTLDAQLEEDIRAAETHFEYQIGQHELRVQAYQGYGKGLIKQFRCSPDAYVQMIIQLAYRKMYGKNRPTYESAATRRFQQGRTETCRTVSDESVAFCDAMCDPAVPANECAELFRKALNAHVKYITDASDGRGVDRHLFGLKKLLKDGEELPSIYRDPAYTYSCTWYISSSQLSSEYFNGYGWSQVIDDGWGIAYMINENSIQFNVVSKHLGCERMSHYLNEAAGDIRDVMVPTMEKPKAKL
ncbi:acyltransferase ChoActase/COT/CPT [Lineolata rhizophorae]|uniref:Carnitine O-acetyltransferase, mitochondrial n=1 Tax=Lineolata rhizophorae TaxID=578093 RepID=A0A6A6NWU0_9PEZI|nr:acyltransferase ChoActase/COT/CPT [Lineolata rhizophorae]